ncbi:hypothetical protein MHYP_G00313850 [Metynnis hypsauchen]
MERWQALKYEVRGEGNGEEERRGHCIHLTVRMEDVREHVYLCDSVYEHAAVEFGRRRRPLFPPALGFCLCGLLALG